MAKLGLNQSELPKIDEEFEAITEGEELRGDPLRGCDIIRGEISETTAAPARED